MTQKRPILAIIAAFCLIFALQAPAMANGGGEEAAAPKEGPLYVDFKNIVVPIIKKNGQTGVVSLSLMAQVDDPDGQSKVMDHLPRLRDAFIRALYGNLESNQFIKDDGALDIPSIKEKLMKTAQLVMKAKADNPIKDLLFQNIAQQAY